MMKVCLVASELLGAHKNGGIGTATTNLACLFAEMGHQVDILYTGEGRIDYGHPWIVRLIKTGVNVTHLDIHQKPVFPAYLRESVAIFDYLRNTDRNLIIFQDWRGGAFACIQARNAGLAFPNTRLVIVAHGPTEWLLEANRTLARSQETLAHLHMERTAFEGADEVLCPSRHMKVWIEKQGFELKSVVHIPLYLWVDAWSEGFVTRSDKLGSVTTLAYFGRLEERKGIGLFLEALLDDRFAYSRFDVHFVGKETNWTEDKIRDYINARRPWLSSRLRFLKDLDSEQSQAHLIEHDCLAVIPSLVDNAPCVVSECLRRCVPFISSTSGGIPELVSENDHDRVLFAPSVRSLADMLDRVLNRAFAPAEPAYEADDVAERWQHWLDGCEHSDPLTNLNVIDNATSEKTRPEETEDNVTVVLTHYERPKLVSQTLQSLTVQTHRQFDVVLVDDGSQSSAALEKLEQIEQASWPFKLQVLRCKNRYLGAARNEGIRAAQSDLIIFMDDDNIAFPDMIEVLLKARRSLNADIVTSQMSIFRDAQGEPDLALLKAGERWCFTGGPTELGLSVNCFGDATGVYKRDVFDKVGYYHEWRGIGHEDWHLHARASIHQMKIASLPVPLYWYRRVEGGMLHTTDQVENNRIIWDVYRTNIPKNLARMIDLSVRNELFP
jgi:glycosyltransferase involved in cell wall biosynthesis/GT2 family glycosyltransferase